MTKNDMLQEQDAPTLLKMMQLNPEIVDKEVATHFSLLFKNHPAAQQYDDNGIHHDPNPLEAEK